MKGTVAGVEAHYRGGNTYLNLVGRNLGRRDEDLNVDGGTAGQYALDFFDDETPHNYMFGARSIYSGIGGNNLSIADAIRTQVQNSTSLTQAVQTLSDYAAKSGQAVDLGLERHKFGGDVTIFKAYPLAIHLGGSNETRNGQRPWSGSFGFSPVTHCNPCSTP
jgi:hypothetical protein